MLPISEIIKGEVPTTSKDDQQIKRSRQEDYKKSKELEEARKAGNAPAAVDEDGKDINPHIPQYISSVPFFYNTTQPSLRHQRVLNEKTKVVPLDTGIQRGIKIQRATTYRKGACENCGAMTHQKKDCLERPRKIGAKFTNKQIAPDEVLIADVEHNFDSKRDRWADYDPDLYKKKIEEYDKVEEAKRKMKEEKLRLENQNIKEQPVNNPDQERKDDLDSDESDDEDDKYADKADMPGTKVDNKQRITVRNLRIREDTAKYLINLDLQSAYYDPKTRAMRENPLPHHSKDGVTYAGENFVRYTGDVTKVNQAQVFAWQAAEKGIDIHLQALPTKAAMIQKEFDANKVEYNTKIENFIAKKYGTQEQQPKLSQQSEAFVEYSRTGKVLKKDL